MIVWLIVGFMLVYIVYKRSGKISGSIPSIGGGDMLIIVAALVVCGGLLWMTSVHAPVFWAAWCSPSIWTMIGSVVIFLACAYLVWRHHTLAYLGMALVICFVIYNYSQYTGGHEIPKVEKGDWHTVENHMLYPGEIWTTSYISGKFRITTEGHQYLAKFKGLDYWTPYKGEAGIFEPIPAGAKAGPIQLKAGENEKNAFVINIQKYY